MASCSYILMGLDIIPEMFQPFRILISEFPSLLGFFRIAGPHGHSVHLRLSRYLQTPPRAEHLAKDDLMGLGVERPELVALLPVALVDMHVLVFVSHLQTPDSRAQLPLAGQHPLLLGLARVGVIGAAGTQLGATRSGLRAIQAEIRGRQALQSAKGVVSGIY